MDTIGGGLGIYLMYILGVTVQFLVHLPLVDLNIW